MFLLCVIVLAGWGLRHRRNSSRERDLRIAAEQKYAAVITELERQAIEFRQHFSGDDIRLHTH